MHHFRLAVLGVVCGLILQGGLMAQRPQKGLPDPANGYDWKAAARKHGLGDKEIEHLAKKKVLVTGSAFKQVFEPYIGSGLPLFITSDSLLGGFHVLFEESVLRLELTNARRLGGILKCVWANLQTADKGLTGKPQLVAAAKLRASIVVATALQLLGEEVELDAAIAPLVQEETARVQAARGRMKPKWLGPPDSGFRALDYTRYQPRGFYVTRPSLQRYFRAVSWLQSIPLRPNNDEELTAILMLGRCVRAGCFDTEPDCRRELQGLLRGFDLLLGSADDWHLLAAGDFDCDLSDSGSGNKRIDLASKTEGLAAVRAELTRRAMRNGEGAKINDQLALIPDDPTLAAELSLRVIPARRTPDAAIFGWTTDPRRFQRDLPSGLELCAVLGSSFARSRLAAQGEAKLIEEIDRCKPLFSGESLYCDYLRCLEVLVSEPEPDAPSFMSGEVWQVKSCQTVLGGWAQLRHTWALQAKQNAHWLCASIMPPGMIEPVPEFFARMARLAERTRPVLRESGAFEVDPASIAEHLRKGVVAEKKMADDMEAADKGLPQQGITDKEWTLAEMARRVIACLPMDESSESEEEDDARMRQKVIELAKQLEQGQMPGDPSLVKTLRAMSPDLDSRWKTIAILCRRLEILAHKQLRGVPFSKDDNRLIEDYGATLAQVMFYDGNSYIHPNDDAPRVVDVFANPNTGRFLEVGVARPRALYVLYPVKGREVLCRGAVVPYYEFSHGDRLTDAQWKSLLDSPQRPEAPDWVRSIMASEGSLTPRRNTIE